MRVVTLLVLTCWITSAQDAPPSPPAEVAAAPAAEAPPAVPVVSLDVVPLAPPDLDTPYASPRDAARHRFQATLSALQSARNVKAGIQGFAEAFAIDRTYAAAAFNLGVLAAIAEKWDDALSAFAESARLDPAIGKMAAPQIERLRLVHSLAATPDGKRRRSYDDALYPILTQITKLPAADAMSALAEVGKIDPKRWEAPALLAGLNGNGRGYDVAARFLEIAVDNSTQPDIKNRLQKALEAAQRELRYAAARATADAAADRAEYDRAGELYERAWAVIPARASNGMDAASAWLLHDDTAHAAALLVRLREAGDTEYAGSAVAMLKELEPIEPAAKGPAADAKDFFRDAGTVDPVFISDLLPVIDRSEMEVLARPLPKLIPDSGAVALLAALAADPAEASQGVVLPDLRAIRVAGENPWQEIAQLRTDQPANAVAQPIPDRGSIIVDTAPPVEVLINGMPVSNATPVELSLQPGLYRIAIAGREREVNLKPRARLRLH